MLASSTLASSPDQYGYRYWCSFCSKSFAKGKRFNAHHGVLNGNGPKYGLFCTVKIFRYKRGSERLCDVEIQKSLKVQELCRSFRIENSMKKIQFVCLVKAHMDEIWTPFFSCSSSWSRPLFRDEWVLIEDFLKNFQWFVGSDGSSPKLSRTRQTLNAFVHYSFHCTSGSLVVCGLQGSVTEGCYMLKTPTIHSVNESYGDTDKGIAGIEEVFQHHKCNSICKHFIVPAAVARDYGLDRANDEDSCEEFTSEGASEECLLGFDSSRESLLSSRRPISAAPPPYMEICNN
ncbi:uncharacterized protein LOC124290168 [Haliotis rubra]|uniref:uncharacterized protein LOC124290168 n=1 Tax=Haliotis rubra TaxID=36100 RepID=UPI001EE5C8F5|nr:uncharacterized protein LOC124290168 [Haliotis rubra]